MAKYLVETFYNCSFKVSHYLEKFLLGGIVRLLAPESILYFLENLLEKIVMEINITKVKMVKDG